MCVCLLKDEFGNLKRDQFGYRILKIPPMDMNMMEQYPGVTISLLRKYGYIHLKQEDHKTDSLISTAEQQDFVSDDPWKWIGKLHKRKAEYKEDLHVDKVNIYQQFI